MLVCGEGRQSDDGNRALVAQVRSGNSDRYGPLNGRIPDSGRRGGAFGNGETLQWGEGNPLVRRKLDRLVVDAPTLWMECRSVDRYVRLMPSLEANESVGVLDPARFDGLRGMSAPRVRPVIGIEVVHPARASDRATSEVEACKPSQSEIARRAYEIYLKRSGRPGTPEGDWSQAERELEAEIAGPTDVVTE